MQVKNLDKMRFSDDEKLTLTIDVIKITQGPCIWAAAFPFPISIHVSLFFFWGGGVVERGTCDRNKLQCELICIRIELDS